LAAASFADRDSLERHLEQAEQAAALAERAVQRSLAARDPGGGLFAGRAGGSSVAADWAAPSDPHPARGRSREEPWGGGHPSASGSSSSSSSVYPPADRFAAARGPRRPEWNNDFAEGRGWDSHGPAAHGRRAEAAEEARPPAPRAAKTTARVANSLARLKSRSGSRGSGRRRASGLAAATALTGTQPAAGAGVSPSKEDIFASKTPPPARPDLPSWLRAEGAEDAAGEAVCVPTQRQPHFEDAAGTIAGEGGLGALVACRLCSRKFNEKAYRVHSRICEKVFQKKRKQFDSQGARLDGTGAQELAAPTRTAHGRARGRAARPTAHAVAAERPVGGGKKGNQAWKYKSQGLRAAIASARGTTVKDSRGREVPAMPAGPDPSLVQCPHCSRRFNQKAADRHIPRCQSIKAKPRTLTRGGGRGGGMTGHSDKRGRVAGVRF